MATEKKSIEQALPVADREIQRIIATSAELQGYVFKPTRYAREIEPCWMFCAVSDQLIEEGYIPGAVFACVDKTDGHIWSDEEFERYAQKLNALKNLKQPEAVAA